MSQIIVCLKKYAKILPTTCCIRLELQTRVTRVTKTTNMADMRDQRTGRERNLSDKQSMSNLMKKKIYLILSTLYLICSNTVNLYNDTFGV